MPNTPDTSANLSTPDTHEQALLQNLQRSLDSLKRRKQNIINQHATIDPSIPPNRVSAIQNLLLEDYRHQCSLEQQARSDYSFHFQSYQSLKSAERVNVIATRTSHLTISINGSLEYSKGFLNFLSLFSAGSVAALITFLSANTELMNKNVIVKSEIYELIGYFLALSVISLILWAISHISTSIAVKQNIAEYDISYFIPRGDFEDESSKSSVLAKAKRRMKVYNCSISILDCTAYFISVLSLVALIYILQKAFFAIQPFIVPI